MKYKYILGLSGGVDSSFALHVMRNEDIVAVSFDNGWDTDIAKENARKMCLKTGIKHKVYTCDLKEFREIQRAFLLAGTPHGETPTDIAIHKTLLNAMKEFGAEKIITGNTKSEGKIPYGWSCADGWYLKDIVRKFGRVKLKTFPNMSFFDDLKYRKVKWNILDDIDYDPVNAKKFLKKEYGWQDYSTKHYESIYTKFNQGLRYWKYGLDMRRVELKHEYDLTKPPYSKTGFIKLGTEICDKLDLDFDELMDLPTRDWKEFKSYRKWVGRIKRLLKKEKLK